MKQSLTHFIRQRDYDRYLCSLFAPTKRQAALHTLIAFNAEISSIAEYVSEEMIGAIRLTWWREALDEIYNGMPVRDHATVRALESTIKTHNLPRALFDQMIESRAQDNAKNQQFDTAESFYDYLKGTVGSLHQLMALTLDDAAATKRHDIVRKQALTYGIVGHLRAIPFHAEQGVIHWPHDILQRFGVNPVAVTNDEAATRLRTFIRHWLGSLPTARADKLPASLKMLNKMHTLSHIYAHKLAKADGNIAALPPRLASMPLRLWVA